MPRRGILPFFIRRGSAGRGKGAEAARPRPAAAAGLGIPSLALRDELAYAEGEDTRRGGSAVAGSAKRAALAHAGRAFVLALLIGLVLTGGVEWSRLR